MAPPPPDNPPTPTRRPPAPNEPPPPRRSPISQPARSAGPSATTEPPMYDREGRAVHPRPPRSTPPDYHRYRAGRRLRLPGGGSGGGGGGRFGDLHPSDAPRPRIRRRRITVRRVLKWVALFVVGWLALSLVLFLVSSHFDRISPPDDVASALDSSGPLLTSANNILVLGIDQRLKGSKEGGAFAQPPRSDTMLLIRTGGGHAAKLSIPRDTVVDIPGHGLQKINAAYAFGGPALTIDVVKQYLGIPINHLVIVNFADFPALVNAMGGITYKGGCIDSNISGGARNGGQTLVLPAGTHHINGEQALIIARTRDNACDPAEDDLGREASQQALFEDMLSTLESPSILLHLPWVTWDAPPTIISDMSGETLMQLFAALAIGGSTPTRLMEPSGNYYLPDGEEGLLISTATKDRAVARFMSG